MKTILISFFLLFPAIVYGSVPGAQPGADSMLIFAIPEVVIEQNRQMFFSEDRKLTISDSLTMALFAGSDAGQLLSVLTSAYINSSGGPGSSSSVFLRGTNSNQTTVNWNGFLLNSLNLGTMDFSLIPVAAIQEITVLHGAAGSIAGSGNFGGSVNLRNRADWNNRLHMGAKSELGTYNNRHLSLSGKIGNERLQYQLLIFKHQAENNFSYNDIYKSGAPLETAQNNALNSTGVIQNLFIKLPGNNNIETGIWYQSRKKELPAIMGSYLPASAMQRDSSLRVYAKWTKRWATSSFSLNTAMFDEHMIYRDKNLPTDRHYSVDSEIQSSRILGDINYRLWLTDFLTVDGGMEISLLSARVDNYGKKVSETRTAAITAVKLSLPGFVSNIAIRKELDRIADIPLLFSAGMKKALLLNGLAFKANYSDQFRIPTFNDRYWQPGGNPGLLPESGYTADTGLMYETGTGKENVFTIEINAYKSGLSNMIQWVPSETGTFWNPENRKEVTVRGLESSILSAGNLGRYSYNLGVAWNYVRSVISATYDGNPAVKGHQLMYVPSRTGSARAGLATEKSFAGITFHYTGYRYTDSENNPLYMMPSFLVFNSYAGHKIKMGGVSGTLLLKVMNLLNARYQVVRSYPMPGRTFHLGFSVEFSQQ